MISRSVYDCGVCCQVEYILTDKTGTLTENIMALKVCCIGGQQFGTFSASGNLLQDSSSTAWIFVDQLLLLLTAAAATTDCRPLCFLPAITRFALSSITAAAACRL